MCASKNRLPCITLVLEPGSIWFVMCLWILGIVSLCEIINFPLIFIYCINMLLFTC